jgi:hypothetical protein
MRLQPERAPNAMNSRRRVSDLSGHGPQAPVRRAFRARFQSLADQARNLVVANRPRCAGPRLVEKPIYALLSEAIAPGADRHRANADLGGYFLVVEPTRRGQNNSRSFGQRLRSTMLARQCRQLASLRIVEYNLRRSAFRHPRVLRKGHKNITDLPIRTLGRFFLPEPRAYPPSIAGTRTRRGARPSPYRAPALALSQASLIPYYVSSRTQFRSVGPRLCARIRHIAQAPC